MAVRLPYQIILIGLTLCWGQAEAYVLVPDDATGAPRRWLGTKTITVVANAQGSMQINDDDEFTALRRAAENWNQAIGVCTSLRIVVEEPTASAVISIDGRVAVIWIDKDWPHPPDWNATTGMQYGAGGQIIDADIEINEQQHQFSTQLEEKKIDLESTLTHELGHVLGLDHPCYLGQAAPDPLPQNHLGQPIPACSVIAESEHSLATMYPAGATANAEIRSPEADDVAGVCALYPDEDEPGGCAVASIDPRAPTAPAPCWPLALVLLLFHRRMKKLRESATKVDVRGAAPG